LAGVAAGVFEDVGAASEIAHVKETVEPNRTTREMYGELFEIYSGLYPSLRGAMHDLTALTKGVQLKSMHKPEEG
jgi:hypothetical protein